MKQLMTLIVLATIIVTFAAEEKKPKRTIEERMQRRYQRHGGKVEHRALMKGNFQIVNCQDLVAITNGDATAAWYGNLLCSDFRYVSKHEKVSVNDAKQFREKLNANAAVFIVDDSNIPALLVAPEECWALVNAAKLKTKDCTDEKLLARLKREIARGIMMVCGTDGVSYGEAAKAIITPADVEYRAPDGIPPDSLMKVGDYLPKIGIVPYVRSTYRRACEEGWAPAPTDTVQKAIWEDVHSVPKNPMTIEYDPKKGR